MAPELHVSPRRAACLPDKDKTILWRYESVMYCFLVVPAPGEDFRLDHGLVWDNTWGPKKVKVYHLRSLPAPCLPPPPSSFFLLSSLLHPLLRFFLLLLLGMPVSPWLYHLTIPNSTSRYHMNIETQFLGQELLGTYISTEQLFPDNTGNIRISQCGFHSFKYVKIFIVCKCWHVRMCVHHMSTEARGGHQMPWNCS